MWQAGNNRQTHQDAGGQQNRIGFAEELLSDIQSELLVGTCARDDQAARHRDHQGRDHGHQAVTNGKHRVRS